MSLDAASFPMPAAPQRTDPRGFIVQALDTLRLGAIPAAAAVIAKADDDGFLGIAIVLALAGVLLAGGSSFIAWWQTTYEVTDDEIRLTRNLLSRQVRSVPYDRVQDVTLTQAALPRLFGLVALTFETGAGAGEDLTLFYLSRAEGERLRSGVRDRLGSPARAAGEPAPEPGEHLLYAMSPRRVLLLGLFNFSLVVFGAAAALMAKFDDVLPFDPWDLDGWQRRLAGPGAWLAGLGLLAKIVGVAGLLLVLGVLGTATGIIRTALREWGFRLDRTPRGLRRRRGLLTRTDMTVPVRRVQAVVRQTGVVRGRLGWHGLSIASLASDAGAAHHQIAPLATMAELAPLYREVGARVPDDAGGWCALSRMAATAESAVRLVIWLLLGTAVLIVQRLLALDGAPGSPLVPLALVLVGLWRALRLFMSLRRTRYRIDHDHLFVRTGWLAPQLITGWREKLQSVALHRGPLARRFGYAGLTFGIAGMALTLPGIELAAARRLRAQLLSSMQRRDFSQVN